MEHRGFGGRVGFAAAAFAAALMLGMGLLAQSDGPAFAEETLPAQSVGALTTAAASEGPNVDVHTQAEIIARLAASGVSQADAVSYAVEPMDYIEPGDLSDATKQSALAMFNNIRYIAGLGDVTLDENQGKLAQAATFVDRAIEQLTHHPAEDGTQPDGMPDEIWNLGEQGASSANIALGQATLNEAVCDWMRDDDASNIAVIGHRRWCINPEMSTTGFGAAGSFYAMHSFDSRASGTQTNVVWPAQNMPIEFFNDTDPWSISVGSQIADASAVKVTLTRQGDGASWVFDSSKQYTASNSGEYFNVDNQGYGQPGCIIFRPEGVTYAPGDVFHVKAENVNGGTIEYDVNFFAGYKVNGVGFAQDEHVCTFGSLQLAPMTAPSDAKSYEVVWSSSDESVATVSESGLVTAGNPGSTTITATIPGVFTASGQAVSASTTVIVPKPINGDYYDIVFGNTEYTGQPIAPTATVTDKATGEVLVEGTDYTVEMRSEITEPGEHDYAFIRGKGKHAYSQYWGFYVAVEKRTLDATMATLSADELTYTGAEQHPAVSVEFNGMTLVEGADYAVSYTGGIAKGDYAVCITGKGDHYRGTCTKTFSIVSAHLDDSMLQMGAPLTYSGAAQQPAFVLMDGDYQLVAGQDFEVSVDREAVEAGDYELTITGKGSYSGTITHAFSIAPLAADPSNVAATWPDLIYNKTQQQAQPDVSVGGIPAVLGRDYTVSYAAGNNNLYGSQSATIDFTGNYAGSVEVSYDIAPLALADDDVVLGSTSFVYNGREQKPAVAVSCGGLALEEGVDYILAWQGGTDAGDASVTVSGIGGCTGSIDKQYAIEPATLTARYAGETVEWDGMPALVVEVAGFVNGESAETVSAYIAPMVVAPDPLTAGTHELTPAGGEAANYVFAYEGGVLTVNPKPAWVSVCEQIEALGDLAKDATLDEQTAYFEAVAAARLAYDELSEADRAKLGDEVIAKLADAEQQVIAAEFAHKKAQADANLQAAAQAQAAADTAEQEATQAQADAAKALTEAKNTEGKTAAQLLGEAQAAEALAQTAQQKAAAFKEASAAAKTAAETASASAAALKEYVEGNAGASVEQVAAMQAAVAAASEQAAKAVQSVESAEGAAAEAQSAASACSAQVAAAKISLSTATIAKIASKTYTGKALKPALVVKVNGKTLKAGVDYKVAYKNNKKVGKATVTVTAVEGGVYTGTKTATFKIVKAKISKAKFSKVKTQKLKKAGKAVKPKVTIKYKGKKLKAGRDYTVTYKNNKKKGTAKIVVKGKGNFKGAKTIKFKIK